MYGSFVAPYSVIPQPRLEAPTRRASMKRLCVHVVATSCAMAFAGAAFAVDNYHDLVRPHGRARSDALFDADLEACYARTGGSRSQPDTPAFKTCMLGRRWQWQSYSKPK